jgi:hypothetical protein
MQHVVIGPRFCGPPSSGHGGYVAGKVATAVGNPAEVTLRRPPPLETVLTLDGAADGATVLRDDATGDVVAEGRPCSGLEVSPPGIARWADAEAAAAWYCEHGGVHPFRSCFGCGIERAPGDGLREFFGPVPGQDGLYAAPFLPDASLVAPRDGGAGEESGEESGEKDEIAPEFVWAALDCPTAAPAMVDGPVCVLGRLAVEQRGPVRVGYRYVVTSWLEQRDGRKFHTAAALCTDMGDVQAVARATWIEVDATAFA